jgi:hypothetical protein
VGESVGEEEGFKDGVAVGHCVVGETVGENVGFVDGALLGF